MVVIENYIFVSLLSFGAVKPRVSTLTVALRAGMAWRDTQKAWQALNKNINIFENVWRWKDTSYTCNPRSSGQLPREKVLECLLQLECCAWLKAAVSTILDSQVFELCTQQAKPCTLKAREFSYGDHSPYLTFLETHKITLSSYTPYCVCVSVWQCVRGGGWEYNINECWGTHFHKEYICCSG